MTLLGGGRIRDSVTKCHKGDSQKVKKTWKFEGKFLFSTFSANFVPDVDAMILFVNRPVVDVVVDFVVDVDVSVVVVVVGKV